MVAQVEGAESIDNSSGLPIMTVDLEDYYHAIVPGEEWYKYQPRIEEPTYFLLDAFSKRGIKAKWFVLGDVANHHTKMVQDIVLSGHTLGSHGNLHVTDGVSGDKDDLAGRAVISRATGIFPKEYRSPYWHSTKRPGFGGGAFFRLLPLSFIKKQIIKNGTTWIHPHDLDQDQPILVGAPLWRYIRLKGARSKFIRLLDELEWGNP